MQHENVIPGRSRLFAGFTRTIFKPQWDTIADSHILRFIIPVMIVLTIACVFLESRAESEYLHQMQVAYAAQHAGPGYSGNAKITMPFATLLIRCGEQLAALFASWILFAGGMWLACLISGTNATTLKTVTSVVLWSWIPYTIRAVIQTIYLALTKTPIYNPGLSGLFVDRTPPPIGVFEYIPRTPAQSLAAAIFAQIDVYLFWHIGLMVLGLSSISTFGRKRSFLIVLCLTVMWAGIGTLLRMPRFR